jgi:hypothetical protein
MVSTNDVNLAVDVGSDMSIMWPHAVRPSATFLAAISDVVSDRISY